MIKLVCVGKIKEKALQSLIGEYLKRLHLNLSFGFASS